MNDIIVQFARLWGQLEATVLTPEDEDVSDFLKGYDSMEVLNLLTKWAEEYFNSDIEDSCDFFYSKINEMVKTEND